MPAAEPDNTKRPCRLFLPGIDVPLVAFFHPETEDLDFETIRNHAIRVARAGPTSLTVQGSNGEAAHLSRDERKLITSAVRAALNQSGFTKLPILVGCGAQSVRETLQHCHDAQSAGGDYALVLPPSYYKAAYSDKVLESYYTKVADGSPLPVVIYNFPAVVAGIDLNSNLVTALAKHPNIVGCKLTCGDTRKLNRVANTVHASTPTAVNSGWICMGGAADFTLQSLVAGGSGVVTGLGNIVPKLCVRVYDLWKAGKWEEAQKLQAILPKADLAVLEGGVTGAKSGLQTWLGYGGRPRLPLPQASEEEALKFKEILAEAAKAENSL